MCKKLTKNQYKKRRFFFYDDEFYFFVRENIHFLLDRSYSADDIESALQHAHDQFWNVLEELHKENNK